MNKKILGIFICMLILLGCKGDSINSELKQDTIKVQKELISILKTNSLDGKNIDMLRDYEYKYDLEQPRVREYNDEEREVTMHTKVVIEKVFLYVENNNKFDKEYLLDSIKTLIN